MPVLKVYCLILSALYLVFQSLNSNSAANRNEGDHWMLRGEAATVVQIICQKFGELGSGAHNTIQVCERQWVVANDAFRNCLHLFCCKHARTCSSATAARVCSRVHSPMWRRLLARIQSRVTKTMVNALLDAKKPLSTHFGAIKVISKLGSVWKLPCAVPLPNFLFLALRSVRLSYNLRCVSFWHLQPKCRGRPAH